MGVKIHIFFVRCFFLKSSKFSRCYSEASRRCFLVLTFSVCRYEAEPSEMEGRGYESGPRLWLTLLPSLIHSDAILRDFLHAVRNRQDSYWDPVTDICVVGSSLLLPWQRPFDAFKGGSSFSPISVGEPSCFLTFLVSIFRSD